MKKISHIWSIICTSSITDKDSNNISLMNTVEKYTVNVPKKEVEKIKDKTKLIIPFNQEIVSRFLREDKKENIIFDIRVDIIAPSKKVIEAKETKTINFDKKFNNIRIINKIANIPAEGSGLYYFSVKIKEVGETEFIEAGTVPVEINIEFEK